MTEKLYTMPAFEIYYIMDYNKIIIIYFYWRANIIVMGILPIAELATIFSFSFHSFASFSILHNSKVWI